MANPDSRESIAVWLESLPNDELNDLVYDAMGAVPGLAEWLEAQRASAVDDVDALLQLVNARLTPTSSFYRYGQSNRYAAEGRDVVELLATRAPAATPELVPVIERAITLTTRAILRSDDSSGMQGDLIRELLDAHATAVRCAVPPLPQKEQTRLVKWLVKYRYGGKQDFFDPDIVAYAPGLTAASIDAYRAAIAATDLGEYGTYPLRRLAVLDRDRDAIVAAHRGEPNNSMIAWALVQDLEEAGLHDDAVHYARLGAELERRGFDSHLIDFLVADAMAREEPSEAVDLRRVRFTRFPSSTTFARLAATAEQAGVWDRERPAAEKLLAERDPWGFAERLLHEERDDEAWGFATAHVALDSSPSLWSRLCERRAVTHPADVLPVYRGLVEGALEVADVRNYRSAAALLTHMGATADAAGPETVREFDAYLADVVDQNRRRTRLLQEFRRAGLAVT